jgi:hypothetical protein
MGCYPNRAGAGYICSITGISTGFVAVWRGQRVHSTGGGTHYFPTEWDAWMFLGFCDVVEGVPAIAAATPAC